MAKHILMFRFNALDHAETFAKVVSNDRHMRCRAKAFATAREFRVEVRFGHDYSIPIKDIAKPYGGEVIEYTIFGPHQHVLWHWPRDQ